MHTVFENEHYLIVDKPAGWLTIPGRQGENDPRPVLHNELQQKSSQKIFVVHRLDAEVTGLVMFAKNAPAHRAGCMWFEHHQIQKTYEAWTEAKVAEELKVTSLTWECLLARGKKRAFEAPHGKPAKTGVNYKGQTRFGGKVAQIFHLQPFTGRSHQLRFEMYRHHMPILGDRLYGAEGDFVQGAIALRAVQLDFRACENRGFANLPDILATKTIAEQFSNLEIQ